MWRKPEPSRVIRSTLQPGIGQSLFMLRPRGFRLPPPTPVLTLTIHAKCGSATAAGQVTATTLMMLPVVLVVDRPWQLPMPGHTSWAAILGLALLCTALAYVIYFRILAAAGATNLLLVTFLIPVSAILLGSQILGERLELWQFAGMGLIGLGLTAIDGRLIGLLSRTAIPAA